MKSNLQAIETFFDGYGNETLKEYGKSFLDILTKLNAEGRPTEEFMQDVTSKFHSLFKLISDLESSNSEPIA